MCQYINILLLHDVKLLGLISYCYKLYLFERQCNYLHT